MRISPEDMFWDWVYGVYLNDDVDRLGRVEAWKPIAAHKFNFIKIASRSREDVLRLLRDRPGSSGRNKPDPTGFGD